VGQLRSLKKDPTKKSFWIDLFFTRGVRKGKFAGFFELREVPLRFIEERIQTATATYEKWQGTSMGLLYNARIEQALDYLFAELGRRTNRKVIQ